jgi:hypothetical protein
MCANNFSNFVHTYSPFVYESEVKTNCGPFLALIMDFEVDYIIFYIKNLSLNLNGICYRLLFCRVSGVIPGRGGTTSSK